jgi:hypothetical protein
METRTISHTDDDKERDLRSLKQSGDLGVAL